MCVWETQRSQNGHCVTLSDWYPFSVALRGDVNYTGGRTPHIAEQARASAPRLCRCHVATMPQECTRQHGSNAEVTDERADITPLHPYQSVILTLRTPAPKKKTPSIKTDGWQRR